MNNFLSEILELKRERVESAKSNSNFESLKNHSFSVRSRSTAFALRKKLQADDEIHIIAEIKRASPSKGIINDKIDIAEVAQMYQRGGAAAISVLTEEDRFGGTLNDLRIARKSVNIPILRKDFVFDEFQIYEAAAAGADVILLIVAMLEDKRLLQLKRLIEDELKLDALIEVHTLEELERAKTLNARIIGVNNRDLHSFKVSLDVSRELIKYVPKETLMIAESGISSREEILELKELGFKGFLIGETLMRSGNPEAELKNLLN
jgi:indole-3-glycerol phosphate synthase